MPEIRFAKPGRNPIQVSFGDNLMKALLAASVPVASSCHGDGVCAKCRIQIVDGMSSLSSPNETEVFLKEKFSMPTQMRISCQTQVQGDITIDASYW